VERTEGNSTLSIINKSDINKYTNATVKIKVKQSFWIICGIRQTPLWMHRRENDFVDGNRKNMCAMKKAKKPIVALEQNQEAKERKYDRKKSK
jgi:hypothetical protein